MKNTLIKKSLNRILQEIYIKNKVSNGFTVEFGAERNSKKNFINLIKKENPIQISFLDKYPKNIDTIEGDLEGKLTFQNNSINTAIIFNVLEHIFNIKNALHEINRCLDNNNGKIIGSTPFIHRVHGAPYDYSRYTKKFIEKILVETNFKNIEVENFGFGPFTSAYTMLFDYLKIIPFLNNIVLTFALIFDQIISFFVKTKLKDIYPVAVCFYGEKK